MIGGKKKKRGAKFSQDRGKRDMVFKTEGQDYGKVEKMLGDMRCSVVCMNKSIITCHIRGRFKRRIWINAGDVILFSYREFEDGKADIIYKYNLDEIEFLKTNGHFDPDSLDEQESIHHLSDLMSLEKDSNLEEDVDLKYL